MGCSSYVTCPDPADPTATLFLQFKYGFLREIEYDWNDEIYWEATELSANFAYNRDARVPAWTLDIGRHFVLSIVANRFVGISEISQAEAERMFDRDIEQTSRHAWAKA